MTIYTIDTAAVLNKLTATGMDETQAQVIVDAIAESNDQVATKSDLAALESRLKLQIYLMGGLVVAVLKALEYLGL